MPKSISDPTIQCLGEFRVVYPLPEDPVRLHELGFDGNPTDGESIVPSQVGPISTFNANGREMFRKDLPKVSQSCMVWASWNDWLANILSRQLRGVSFHREGPNGQQISIRHHCGYSFYH